MAWQQFGRLPRPPTWLHAVGVKSSKCSGSPEAPGYCPRFVSLVYTERLPCCLRWMFLKTGRLRRHFCRLMEVWPENKAAPTGFYARARSQMIRNRALICRVLFLFHRRGFIWLQRDFTLCDNVGKRSILQLLKLACFVDTANANVLGWLNRAELWRSDKDLQAVALRFPSENIFSLNFVILMLKVILSLRR